MALNMASVKLGAPIGDLRVESSTLANYPLSGKTVYEISISNTNKMSYITIVLDDNGQEQNRDDLIAAEKAARTAKYGKLDQPLADYLATNPPDEVIPVSIQLVEPDIGKPCGDLRPDPKRLVDQCRDG